MSLLSVQHWGEAGLRVGETGQSQKGIFDVNRAFRIAPAGLTSLSWHYSPSGTGCYETDCTEQFSEDFKKQGLKRLRKNPCFVWIGESKARGGFTGCGKTTKWPKF
jgi:hypothetical protein